MISILDRYAPVREGEGGGNGGGTPPPANPGAPPPADPNAPPANPGATPPPPDPNAPPAPPSAYRPDGLPDTMFGKDDRETIDKLHNAMKGYRDRDAQRGVPDKPEAYLAIAPDVPDSIKPHIEALAKDPLYSEVSRVALEEKVPVGTMQKLTSAFYQAAEKAGILEPMIDPAAERAALLPAGSENLPKERQDAAIDARLQANEDFVTLMTGQGLDKGVGEHALLMLMDSAKGNRFIEFMREKLTGGGQPLPLAGNGTGGTGTGREGLKARLAAPEMNPQHPQFNRAAYDALMADYQKAAGE